MTPHTYLLIDGAVARGSALLRRAREAGAIALYADLGEAAAEVGPWLLPGAGLDTAVPAELPLRHGMSALETVAETDILVAHLHTLRYIHTADGQRFYGRYADMRALQALCRVLTDAQRHALLGPVDAWRCTDRYGRHQVLRRDPALALHEGGARLSLDDTQLAQLLRASLADQLCAALMERREPALLPDIVSEQFALIEHHALPFIHSKRVERWPLQLAVARQFVLHGASLAEDAGFANAVEHASHTGAAEALDHWQPMRSNPSFPDVPR